MTQQSKKAAVAGIFISLSVLAAFIGTELLTLALAAEWLEDNGIALNSGFALSLSVLAATPVFILLTAGYMFTRAGNTLGALIRPRALPPLKTALYIFIVLVLQAITSFVIIKLDRDPAEFAIDTFQSAGIPALYVLAVVFIGPIVEEIIFRGMLYTHMSQAFSPLKAALASSALWAAIHTQYGLPEAIYIFILGLMLCRARQITANISMPLTIHIANNAITVGLVMLGTGQL